MWGMGSAGVTKQWSRFTGSTRWNIWTVVWGTLHGMCGMRGRHAISVRQGKWVSLGIPPPL